MSDFERRFSANAQQAEYWNSEPGQKWVKRDEEMDRRLQPLTDELIRRSDIRHGDRVLDIGCGGGSSTEQFAHVVGSAGRVLGVDISEPLLALAQTRCANLKHVTFENIDAQAHSFSGHSFDLLLSRLGVMFFSDPPAAFANLLRALRPTGKLHFVCWASVDKNPWFLVPLNIAVQFLGSLEPTPARAPGPLAFSEPEYVEDILATAGFRDIQIETVETTMMSSDSPEQQAELYLTGGPAARLIAAKSPNADTMGALTAGLVSELQKYETENGIALGATVHCVAASA
jgi:ubiquinone/menaquinone biosynthesis C-methylase UbiE